MRSKGVRELRCAAFESRAVADDLVVSYKLDLKGRDANFVLALRPRSSINRIDASFVFSPGRIVP